RLEQWCWYCIADRLPEGDLRHVAFLAAALPAAVALPQWHSPPPGPPRSSPPPRAPPLARRAAGGSVASVHLLRDQHWRRRKRGQPALGHHPGQRRYGPALD